MTTGMRHVLAAAARWPMPLQTLVQTQLPMPMPPQTPTQTPWQAGCPARPRPAWRGRRGVCLAVAAAALACASGAGRAAPAPIQLHDDLGRRLQLAAPAQRIVSLLPSLTESVCALGACARLVGVDRWSNWPAAVQALPRLGGLDDAPLERILVLKPDLVLVAASARVHERLQALGVPVLALEPRTLADTRRVLQVLAQALGRPAAADALWQQMQQALAQAAARVPAGWRGQRAYFEVSTAPHAAGAGSFIGELLTALGLGNIVPASMGPFPQLNPEFVVRAQPALVLAESRALAGMAARPGWHSLPALAAGRRCGFGAADYDPMVRPGPRLAEAAAAIVACLQRLEPPR